MPVTELANFHLKNNKGLDALENEDTKTAFLIATKKQAADAGYPVYIFTQVEDPSHIYLLGGWDSVEAHVEKWIPSEENQKLLASVQDGLDVVWVHHIDIDPVANENGSGVPLSAPVIAIGRFFLQGSKKASFQDDFSANKHYLEAFTAPKSFGAGWRLDSEGSGEEFVVFSGWDTIEDHGKFAASDGFKDFEKIKAYLDGTDIKHAVRFA
jgi:hypothetical protein